MVNLQGSLDKLNSKPLKIVVMGIASMLIIILGAVLFLNPLFVSGAQISCPPTTLRVALGLNLSSTEFSVFEGKYELVDYITQRVISTDVGNGVWMVAPAGNSNIQIYNNGNSINGLGSFILILRQKDNLNNNVFQYMNKRYRGNIVIENLNGRLQIINFVDVEKYLYGVVGSEMIPGAPEEAYKSQAVVSRTYALYHKEHPQLNYDVGISTQWQVYGGYDSEVSKGTLVKKAVDDTYGQVVYYDNSLIQAFFHSNSGGYTESCENVWYSNFPYIQPVYTPEDACAIQVPQSGGWPGNTYSWEKSFTRDALMDKIKNWNNKHSDNIINVGEIQEISVSRLAVDPQTREDLSTETESGRATQLDFIGTRGVKSFERDGIRPVFGLRSTLFEVIYDSTVKVWNAFGSQDVLSCTKNSYGIDTDKMVTKLNGNETYYYVLGNDGITTVPKTFTKVIFKGKGNGHGLGMSQWGAYGMALKGNDYKKIIEHFYNQDKYDGKLEIRQY
ncbi:MAG: SpoIID/LytB domain-containing protein [Clostridia bacterium]|nr:SpoIID/LytB domain-containing protein [Clostridia bacterium]MDD4047221.1 SpoIID/LytB domain-containing protein [Clostridia bacterium]